MFFDDWAKRELVHIVKEGKFNSLSLYLIKKGTNRKVKRKSSSWDNSIWKPNRILNLLQKFGIIKMSAYSKPTKIGKKVL